MSNHVATFINDERIPLGAPQLSNLVAFRRRRHRTAVSRSGAGKLLEPVPHSRSMAAATQTRDREVVVNFSNAGLRPYLIGRNEPSLSEEFSLWDWAAISIIFSSVLSGPALVWLLTN
jgi:hypothetical protein